MAKISLAESHPALAKQSDGWDASSVTAGSQKKLPWKCEYGHSWDAVVANRVRGNGCPYCSNTRVLPGFNDLATMFPDIAVQAAGWDPTTLLPGTSKKLRWICSKGHTWEATVNSRTTNGSGCPYCTGKRVIPGETDLLTTHPELASEAHEWDPNSVKAGSPQALNWLCPKGHVYEMGISSRARGYGCPVCSSHRIIPGVNDLTSLYPAIAREADGWDPSGLAPATTKKMAWRCGQGHKWIASIASRTRLETNCPYCSGRNAIPGTNDIATLYPEFAREAVGWDPSQVLPGSEKKKRWRCSSGHEYEAVIKSRTLQGTGCPYCSGRLAVEGESDILTKFPQIAAEALGWDPKKVSAFSGKKMKWLCPQGHEYIATVSNRTRMHSSCPFCSNQKVLIGYNDMETTHFELARDALGWDPRTVIAGTTKKLRWACPVGHQFLASGAKRVAGSGCPYCSSVQILVGFNDLATTRPDLALELVSADPTKLMAGSNKAVEWRCESGHTWKASPANRNNGTGCPSCAKSGFDPNIDGYIYFLRHEAWGMLQIGITNHPEKRLAAHRSLGWDVIEVRGPLPGDIAKSWEQSILKSLRRRNAALGQKGSKNSFDGFTEAWVEETWPSQSLYDLMNLVHNDEA